jgi:hypothetical protein
MRKMERNDHPQVRTSPPVGMLKQRRVIDTGCEEFCYLPSPRAEHSFVGVLFELEFFEFFE